MTSTLIAAGYRRIGFVGAQSANNDRTRERQLGYKAAMAAAGLSVRPNMIVETALGIAEGAAALARLRRTVRGLDAVFLAGDMLAAGALYECARQGISVPGDVAIAGFDDQPIASQTVPPLTTVAVKREEIGRTAAKFLLERISGRQLESHVADVGFRIIVREST